MKEKILERMEELKQKYEYAKQSGDSKAVSLTSNRYFYYLLALYDSEIITKQEFNERTEERIQKT